MRITVITSLLGLASCPAGTAATTSPTTAGLSSLTKRDALADCLSAVAVPTDAPAGADWDLDVAPFNLRLNYTPAAIVVPTTTRHVQDAVACAARAGVKANAKCGGHSYGSFGLGGEDGHLVVEMDRMNRVVLDGDTGIATVEGGARLGHVASELYAQGKRAFSHGTCPGVGVGGHTLHGGYGVSSHTKGLALDWLVGATVVLANATVVEASETENADIFWALRGAGSSMGIVTSMRFRTFAPPATLTVFVASLPWTTQAKAAAGFRALQDYAVGRMPAELNMRLFVTGRFANLEGLYYGDRAGLQRTLGPLLNRTGGAFQMQQEGGWLDQVAHFGNGIPLDQGHPYNYHDTFFSSSLYTRALTAAQIDALTSYWFRYGKSNRRDWYLQLDLHGGNTSAVAARAVDSTSYTHRDYLYMYSFYDRVDRSRVSADGAGFVENFVANITASLDDASSSGSGSSSSSSGSSSSRRWGQYINYPDPQMSQDTAQQRYWGRHLPRLQQIKAAVDPDDLFHYPQGVLPAKANEVASQ